MPNDANLPEPTQPSLSLLQTTGPSGVALQNGTPTILSWTAPNDGGMHRVQVITTLDVTTLEVGGAVTLNVTPPLGSAVAQTVQAAAQAAGSYISEAAAIVKAGSTVTVAQSSALTGGAAILWAELWGS